MGHKGQVELETSIGYLLKQASVALRTAMDVALEPLGLTVTEYSCLELLGQVPGLSNSDLARGTFVTRQSMNVVLRAMEKESLVTRAAKPSGGRTLPVRLTARGEDVRAAASTAVRGVELRMLHDLDADQLPRLRTLLGSCIGSLGANGLSDV